MTANRSELILKQTKKLLTEKALNCRPFQEGICEIGHHEKNLTLTSSLKMINVHYVALLLDLVEQFFPLVQLVNCEFSFTWIAVLRRQVDAKTVYF